MRIFFKVVSNIALVYLIVSLAGCGITAGGLHNHSGYADIESPYWWQASSEVNLSLGPLIIGAARWAIDEGEELDALLDDVDGVRVSVFKIEDNEKLFIDDFTETKQNLLADGWQQLVRVKDADDDSYTLMFAKSNGDIIYGLVVLTLSDDEAVFVNLIGNIHPDSFDPIMEQIYKNELDDKNTEETTVAKE